MQPAVVRPEPTPAWIRARIRVRAAADGGPPPTDDKLACGVASWIRDEHDSVVVPAAIITRVCNALDLQFQP